MTKPITVVRVAIDASGSMYGVAADVRGGFNQYMATLAADTDNEYRIHVALFNTSVEHLAEDALPADVHPLDEHNYVPMGGTALHDAIGRLITDPAPAGSKVLIVIHTDGKENSSREWRKNTLVPLIESRKAEGWTFVFLGAGVDTWQHGEDLGMSSASTRESRAGTRGLYKGLITNTVGYASGGVTGQSIAGGIAAASEEAERG